MNGSSPLSPIVENDDMKNDQRAQITQDYWESGFRGARGKIIGIIKNSNYWFKFDVPTDDGSGDGPYMVAEIPKRYLKIIK